MESTSVLYEKFKEKFEGVNGECYRIAKTEELGDLIINVLANKGARTVSLYESPISQAAKLKDKLSAAGFEVHTENLFAATSQDDVGITEVNWGIAELGTLVQIAPEVDNRLCSTLVPIHLALLKTNCILADLDEVLEILDRLPQIPGFVGFITGPSRSSDIERILEIGVHGPEQVILVLVDE
ncbi:MAG: LutC/YkgG family protein [Desulfitobacteriia bacterium]|jgi:L-lactate dehydrogenase complex protein LldG